MSKKRIITDDMDLSNKTAMTDDSFYNSKIGKSSDSSGVSPIYKGKSRFFALLSTSDKAINNRLYDKESWKKTVMDGSWEGPLYAKPMIRNHDIREQTPFGRIKDSYFVEHGSFDTINKESKKLDKKVLDFYKNAGALNSGSGSVIVEFSSDEVTANRIISGLDATVSQSSYFKDASCTVCGSDYFGNDCTHVAGRHYSIKKDDVSIDVECLVLTKDFEPIELSIVNTPANDTSVIFVLDEPSVTSKDEIGPSEDSKETPGIDGIENKCKDSVNDKTNPTEDKDKMFKEMLKDTLTANIKKEISDKAEMLTAFETLFDAATEETLPLVKALMDEIAKVVETIKTESAEAAEAEEVTEEVVETEPVTESAAEEVVEETTEVVEEEVKEETETEDSKAIEEKVKDALGVVKEKKTSNDNRIINTIIKGLKL
ncbi:MAG: hypothetical protein ACRC0G_12590 [Fusobacteriaceae bacterium]